MAHEYAKIDDSTAVVTVGRELSSGGRNTVNELRDLCRRLAEEGKKRIILDFSDVKVCPSVVLGNIIVLDKRLKENGGGVALAAPAAHVAKAARIVGLNRTIPSFDSVDDAVKSTQKEEDNHESCD